MPLCSPKCLHAGEVMRVYDADIVHAPSASADVVHACLYAIQVQYVCVWRCCMRMHAAQITCLCCLTMQHASAVRPSDRAHAQLREMHRERCTVTCRYLLDVEDVELTS